MENLEIQSLRAPVLFAEGAHYCKENPRMKRTDFFKCVFASQTLAVLRPYDEYGRELMDISVPQGAKNYKLTERTRTEIFVSSCELHLAGVDTKIAELNVQLRALQATRTDLKETIEKLKCTIS